MKLLIPCIVLVLACHNGERVGATTGSGSSSGATNPEPAGSAARPEAVVSGAGSGSATAVASSSDPLAKAIDDFDRLLAPIWKLPEDERFRALCPVVKDLFAKSDALKAIPNPAADWEATTDGLWTALADAKKRCSEQPQNRPPDGRTIADVNSAYYVQDVHDNFAKVAALVPGASAIDTHASDPTMKK